MTDHEMKPASPMQFGRVCPECGYPLWMHKNGLEGLGPRLLCPPAYEFVPKSPPERR